MESEASVHISIKDVRYGDSYIKNPSITTIYEGNKLVLPIPFERDLFYEYEKVEDPMTFKFAITQEDDLLGFLYLEIP